MEASSASGLQNARGSRALWTSEGCPTALRGGTIRRPRRTRPMRTANLRLLYALIILLGINTMNFFDRQILAAVQEKIRKDWNLSDSELGWLGTAFILLYAVVGLPLGRLADIWQRKWLLAGSVALWSLLTFGSGLAWNFWSLFLMR